MSVILFLLINCISIAQTEIQKIENELAFDPDLKGASYAWCLMDVGTDKVMNEHQSESSLVPASTLKLLTTSSALMALGKNYKYETQLYYNGIIKDGELNGDIIIKGGGDPSLGSRHFPGVKNEFLKEWLVALQKVGIKSINGNLICDDSYFDGTIPSTWIWADLSNYFGVAPHGINYHDNLYSIYFKSGEAGSNAEIVSTEPLQQLEFNNQVKAGGKGDNAFIYGSPNETTRLINGTIPPNQNKYAVDGAMPKPWFSLAKDWLGELSKSGIKLKGQIKLSEGALNYSSFKKFHSHYSPSLEKIAQMCNLHSDNLYAETLLRTIGAEKGKSATAHEGIVCEKKFWEERGLSMSGVFVEDGSGLSRFNAVSVKFLCKLLAKVSRDSLYSNSFQNTLALAGSSGTLNGMFNGSYLENNLRAKSGYMTRARSYAGYFTDKAGRKMCFAVIFNNYSCSPTEVKKKMARLIRVLAE